MNLNPSFPSKSLQLPQAPGFHPNITGIPRSLCCMLSCLARFHGWIKWQSLWGPLVKASMVSMGLYPDLKHRKWYLKTLNLIPYIPWFHGDHGDEVQNLKIPRLSRFYRRNVRKKPLHPRVSSFSMFPFFFGMHYFCQPYLMPQAPRNSSTPQMQRPLQPCLFAHSISHPAEPAHHKDAKPSVISITSFANLSITDM